MKTSKRIAISYKVGNIVTNLINGSTCTVLSTNYTGPHSTFFKYPGYKITGCSAVYWDKDLVSTLTIHI